MKNTIEENEAASPETLPLGGATCAACGGCGMIPGLEPDDDVMNTPCPKCNPWAKKRWAIHDRCRPLRCLSRLVRLGYRLRYSWRKIVNFVGLCYRCGSSVNFTRSGKAICPKCGK